MADGQAAFAIVLVIECQDNISPTASNDVARGLASTPFNAKALRRRVRKGETRDVIDSSSFPSLRSLRLRAFALNGVEVTLPHELGIWSHDEQHEARLFRS
jgi:hypothetical protein